jgi:hypothetical protein
VGFVKNVGRITIKKGQIGDHGARKVDLCGPIFPLLL